MAASSCSSLPAPSMTPPTSADFTASVASEAVSDARPRQSLSTFSRVFALMPSHRRTITPLHQSLRDLSRWRREPAEKKAAGREQEGSRGRAGKITTGGSGKEQMARAVHHLDNGPEPRQAVRRSSAPADDDEAGQARQDQ